MFKQRFKANDTGPHQQNAVMRRVEVGHAERNIAPSTVGR